MCFERKQAQRGYASAAAAGSGSCVGSRAAVQPAGQPAVTQERGQAWLGVAGEQGQGSVLLLKVLFIVVQLHPGLLCLWRLPLCCCGWSSLLHSRLGCAGWGSLLRSPLCRLCRCLLPGQPGGHLWRQLCSNLRCGPRPLCAPLLLPLCAAVAWLRRPLWGPSHCRLRLLCLGAAWLAIPLPHVALLLLLLARVGSVCGRGDRDCSQGALRQASK